jgi:hypothetical protein
MRNRRALRVRQTGITRAAVPAVIALGVCALPTIAQAQGRPSFCDQTPASQLNSLQAPYTVRSTPGGKPYCEGLMLKPIGLPPPTVVSVKQAQVGVGPFSAAGTSLLTWCDDPQSPLHLRLRSVEIPLFGLDAMQAGQFSWRTDVVATWQPQWTRIAALGTRPVTIAGQTDEVSIPLRIGQGYSSTYNFLIKAQNTLSISKALIEPVQPAGDLRLVDVVLMGGPSKNTWLISMSFAALRPGLYRVTFEDSTADAGLTTTPILVLHKTCPPHD